MSTPGVLIYLGLIQRGGGATLRKDEVDRKDPQRQQIVSRAMTVFVSVQAKNDTHITETRYRGDGEAIE